LSTVAALLKGLRARACSPQTLTAGLHELAGAAAGDVPLRHRQPLWGTASRCRLGHMMERDPAARGPERLADRGSI